MTLSNLQFLQKKYISLINIFTVATVETTYDMSSFDIFDSQVEVSKGSITFN